jgi:hypothetical protein
MTALFALAIHPPAHAAEFSPHSQHAWIAKHKTPNGVSCCDSTDCFVLEPSSVVERHDGYYLLEFGEVVPFGERKASEDGRFYRCQWPDRRRRCFFAPYSGS